MKAMNVYRIHISSWTASFRYPNLISGFQATLPVPPLSTIYGLISAAMGRYFYPNNQLELGFVFQTKWKAQDLETIYQVDPRFTSIKSNVVTREFLVDNDLWIYTLRTNIAKCFEKPYFPLLLGRSGDLATINSIKEITVQPRTSLSRLKGTIVPFDARLPIAAPIHALPLYFSEEIPRRNVGTKPYFLLSSDYRQNAPIEAEGFWDEERQWEVYWQK